MGKADYGEAQASTRLGSRIAARFERVGLDRPIAELRGQTVVPAQFDDRLGSRRAQRRR